MKLPKTVQICGKPYSVKPNSRRWGGRCETGKQELCVGTKKDQSSQRIFDNFMHEVLEATALEKSLRYRSGDDELVFVMTHKQFDAYAEDIATALWPIVKKRK